MTKKLLLLFTCIWVLPISPMQEMLTQDQAANILQLECAIFLAFSSTTDDYEQCSRDYVKRLIDHMRRYPDSQDIWEETISDSLSASINLISPAIWQFHLEAAKSTFGADVAQEIATNLVSLIHARAIMTIEVSYLNINIQTVFKRFSPYMKILFNYDAKFSLESISNFYAITLLFEEYALHLTETTLFGSREKNVVAYHLLKSALNKADQRAMLSKKDLQYDDTLLQLSAENILNILRNRELNGPRQLQVKSNYAPSLLNAEPLWKGRIFQAAYATNKYSDQAEAAECLRSKAGLTDHLLQEILFQGKKLPLSYEQISQTLHESNIHAISDDNSDIQVDQIFQVLLQDDQKSLRYYMSNKETILASIKHGYFYWMSDILLTAEEIRTECNSIFCRLKDFASSCSIQ